MVPRRPLLLRSAPISRAWPPGRMAGEPMVPRRPPPWRSASISRAWPPGRQSRPPASEEHAWTYRTAGNPTSLGRKAVEGTEPRPRQRAPLGICHRRRRGIRAAGFRSCGILLADQRSAPSRSRLRPAHPIDLRRSDCRAGEPSTFGAPCSVHSESYWLISTASRACESVLVANCDFSLSQPFSTRVTHASRN